MTLLFNQPGHIADLSCSGLTSEPSIPACIYGISAAFGGFIHASLARPSHSSASDRPSLEKCLVAFSAERSEENKVRQLNSTDVAMPFDDVGVYCDLIFAEHKAPPTAYTDTTLVDWCSKFAPPGLDSRQLRQRWLVCIGGFAQVLSGIANFAGYPQGAVERYCKQLLDVNWTDSRMLRKESYTTCVLVIRYDRDQ